LTLNFICDARDVYCDKVFLFSDVQTKILETWYLMTVKTRPKNQIGMDPNLVKNRAMHEGDDSSFWNELMKLFCFLPVNFISYFSSKHRSTNLIKNWEKLLNPSSVYLIWKYGSRRVRPVDRGCLHLLGMWFHLRYSELNFLQDFWN
jgi:hypothetical protein